MRQPFAEHRRRWRRATWRAAAMAGVGVFVLLSLPLLTGFAYYGLDLTRDDLGILCAIDHQLADGSGLWLSSLLGNGAAFFARPEVSLLYPPRWVAVLLPPDLGATWRVVAHMSLAAAGTTWLARTFRIRPWLAAATGVCFALSGTALDLSLHALYIVGAAWMPFAWASARCLLSPRRRPLHAVALGTTLGLLLLGGEPQAFGIACGLVGLELIQHAVRFRRRALVPAGMIVVTVVASLGIGMAQWAPTLAEMAITQRGGVLDAPDAMKWAFTPGTWAAVLWPGWLDEFVWPAVNVWGIWLDNLTEPLPWNRQPYVGSLFVALAVCGVFLRRSRLPAIVMIGATALALGDQIPVLPLITELFPPAGLFRYPAKYLVVATLGGTLVVGLFAQTLATSRTAGRRFLLAGGLLFAGQVLVLVALAASADDLDRITATIGTGVESAELDLPRLGGMLRSSVLHSMAPLALAFAVVAALPRLRPALLTLVIGDLLLAAPQHLLLGPRLEDLHSPLARAVGPEAVVCIEPALMASAFFSSEGGVTRWGHYAYLRGLPYPELNACDRSRSAIPYSPLRSAATIQLERGLTHRRAAAARALGCSHFVTRRAPPDGGEPMRLDEPWWHAYRSLYRAQVYEVSDPLPPVFVARNPRVVTPDNLVGALNRARGASAVAALVDNPMGESTADLPDGVAVRVTNVEWNPHHVARITLHGSGGAVVGLRTAFQVGWSATQNDEQLAVVRLAGHHVGAVVPDASAGPVTFTYRPPRFGLGLILAALGAAAIAVVALRLRRVCGPGKRSTR